MSVRIGAVQIRLRDFEGGKWYLKGVREQGRLVKAVFVIDGGHNIVAHGTIRWARIA